MNGTDVAKEPLAVPAEQRPDAWWWLLVAVIVLVISMIVISPDPYRDIFVFTLDGIALTLGVTITAYVLTLGLGLFGGLGRLSKSKPVYFVTTLYVEVIRGIPLLVQLIWWYFAFPVLIQSFGRAIDFAWLANYQANPIAMAIMGLVFCYGAYMSEIYRAGIQSIPIGQMEAALSVGMTRWQAMRHIIIPQTIRVILPPMGNEFIALLKDSSLVSAVAVVDLTRRGREFMAANFNPIETWMMIALIYLMMTLFFSRIVAIVERRTKTSKSATD